MRNWYPVGGSWHLQYKKEPKYNKIPTCFAKTNSIRFQHRPLLMPANFSSSSNYTVFLRPRPPWLSAASNLAPAATKALTTSRWPFSAATTRLLRPQQVCELERAALNKSNKSPNKSAVQRADSTEVWFTVDLRILRIRIKNYSKFLWETQCGKVLSGLLHLQSRTMKAGNETNPKNSETNADFAKTVAQLRNYTKCTYAASFTELFWIEKCEKQSKRIYYYRI